MQWSYYASASCHGGINLVSAFLVDKWVGVGEEEKERDERMKRQTEERRRFKCFIIVRAITTL